MSNALKLELPRLLLGASVGVDPGVKTPPLDGSGPPLIGAGVELIGLPTGIPTREHRLTDGVSTWQAAGSLRALALSICKP